MSKPKNTMLCVSHSQKITLDLRKIQDVSHVWIYPIAMTVPPPHARFTKFRFQVSDLRHFFQALQKNTGFSFRSISFDRMEDAEAARTKILEQLEQDKRNLNSNGYLVPVSWLQKLPSAQLRKYVRLAKPIGWNVANDGVPVENLPLDPRYLGMWLGDGTSACANITTMDKEIVDYLQTLASKFPGNWYWRIVQKNGRAATYALTDTTSVKVKGKTTKVASHLLRTQFVKFMHIHGDVTITTICETFGICTATAKNWQRLYAEIGDEFAKMHSNPIQEQLLLQGVSNNKHIPEIYFHANREAKLLLLAGLLDTDGSLKGNSFEITQKSNRIAADIKRLVTSLGFFILTRKKKATCTNGTSVESKTGIIVNRMSIFGCQMSDIPCLLPRKQCLQTSTLPTIEFVANDFQPILKSQKRDVAWNESQDRIILANPGMRASSIRKINPPLFKLMSRHNMNARVKLLHSRMTG